MKLIEEKLVQGRPGTVKIIAEEPDDLWVAYNLIAPGDIITADTTRKVIHTTDSGNAKGASRVKVKLEVKITAVDYDKDSSTVRVRGKNIAANEYISTNAFHTLVLEKNKEFDLRKKIWDSAAIEALREGCGGSSAADLAVILMQPGLAQMFLVGNKETTLCAKIETENTVSTDKFFENVFRAFRKHVDFEKIRCAVIGSPCSIKDEFRLFIMSEARRQKLKSIEENKSRIVLVSTGNKNGLREVLHDNKLMNLIKDTKAVMEIRAFKEFTEILSEDSGRACYGSKSVEAAQELMAIETLLITDELYRNSEIGVRKKYIELVKSVKKAGGKAFVYSSMHVSAEQLAQLTGIAAILRFPLPDLEEMEL